MSDPERPDTERPDTERIDTDRPDTERPRAERVAVVLMAYGTPTGPDDIEAYYTDIRRGRPPTPEALADLVRRYEAIGGVSPLAEITEAQRAAIAGALHRLDPGRYEVRLGFKHAAPKVEATAGALVEEGYRRIVGLVLAPHYSVASIGGYVSQLRAGIDGGSANADDSGTDDSGTGGAPVEATAIESWATEPAYLDFLSADLRTRLDQMRGQVRGKVRVLFTAHSLPRRVIDGGDPYADELRATAEAVAARLGLVEEVDWEIAWQSAGRTPEPWIGPDVLEVLDRLGSTGSVASGGSTGTVGGVIVCACGFVADHLEVLYDLDIEAAGRAQANALAFDRTSGVADDPSVMEALARRIHAATSR